MRPDHDRRRAWAVYRHCASKTGLFPAGWEASERDVQARLQALPPAGGGAGTAASDDPQGALAEIAPEAMRLLELCAASGAGAR